MKGDQWPQLFQHAYLMIDPKQLKMGERTFVQLQRVVQSPA